MLGPLRRTRPDIVALGECVSLTSTIDRALLRAARLMLVPTATSATEADLWFSPLVAAASPDRIMLDRSVLSPLRAGLVADPKRLDAARQLVVAAHAHAGAVTMLHDELIWLGLRGDGSAADEIDRRLRQIAATLVERPSQSTTVARWLLRALPALPLRVRETPGCVALCQWTAEQLDTSVPGAPAVAPADLGVWKALTGAGETGTIDVGVRLTAGSVELTPRDDTSAHRVAVPAPLPANVDLGVPDLPPAGSMVATGEPAAVQVSHLALVAHRDDVTVWSVVFGDIVDVAAAGSLPVIAVLLARRRDPGDRRARPSSLPVPGAARRHRDRGCRHGTRADRRRAVARRHQMVQRHR